jgi:hypothetical protein
VTGASAALVVPFVVLFGVLDVGVVASVSVVAALEASSVLACLRLRRFLRGVASAAIAGGWIAAALA